MAKQSRRVRTGSLKRRTLEGYADLVRLHIIPAIGFLQLSELRPLHVERVYDAMRAKGLSERTVLHAHRHLYTALKDAVRVQYVARNVAEAIERPQPRSKEVKALDVREVPAIISAVSATDLKFPTLIALGTGARRGEVLGLRWMDLDLTKGTARLSQALSDDGSFETTKNHKSRIFYLPGFLIEALKAHRKEQNERRLLCGVAWQELDLVVDRGDGGPMRVTSLSQRFRHAIDKAGIRPRIPWLAPRQRHPELDRRHRPQGHVTATRTLHDRDHRRPLHARGFGTRSTGGAEAR